MNDILMRVAMGTVDGFHGLSLAADGGTREDVEGVFCWYSSSYVPLFNGASFFSSGLVSAATLEAIDTFFVARGRPYSVITLDGLVEHIEDDLKRLGYEEFDTLPAMWLQVIPPARSGSADVQVTRVTGAEELAMFRRLLIQVFYIPPAEVELIMADRVLRVAHIRHYLGWLDGKPVGTTTLVSSRSTAGIWNVGTLPDYRGMGVATELVRHALSEALEWGCTSSMLLASTEALSLYARLGYIELSVLRTFLPTGQMGGC